MQAGQQLSTELLIGSSLGTFSHKNVADLGDFAKQMVFIWSFPPATTDLPVYKALRADLAASGDEALQPENLKASPMRSWIGLYALLKMIRDAKMTTFTREGITKMLNEAKDVPMLDIFGGENWTPSLNHPGIYKRAGTNHWAIYGWDPKAKAPAGRGQLRREGEDQLRRGALRVHLRRPQGRRADRVNGRAGSRSTPARCSGRHEPPGRPVTVQSFVQFLIIGLGAGATYALFAQGAVLIYRGSGLVNFAQGAIGTFAAYIAFVDLKDKQRLGDASLRSSSPWSPPARCRSLFQVVVLRALRRAAAIVRVIATIGLLGLLQAVVAKRYGVANQPVDVVPPPRGVPVGEHHRPGGADLPRRASRWS